MGIPGADHLTVPEAARRLDTSEYQIRKLLAGKHLSSLRSGRRLYVTKASVEAEQVRRRAAKGTAFDRRRALLVLGKAAQVGLSGAVFFVWNKLAEFRESPVAVEDVFPMWADIQVVPGEQNPNYGYHPDTQIALDRLTPLVPRSGRVVVATSDDLPNRDLARDLLLIGGPVSSADSRNLHGHTFENGKLSPLPTGETGFRWRFWYPYGSQGDPSFSRYVKGELRTTMPKALIDRRAMGLTAKPQFSKYDPETGLVLSDYLLVTVVPNTFLTSATGRTIIDIASLHGQGEKVFPDVLRDHDRRKELFQAVNHKQYFQALYELPISHDLWKKETTPGPPELKDVWVFG